MKRANKDDGRLTNTQQMMEQGERNPMGGMGGWWSGDERELGRPKRCKNLTF